MAGAKQRSKPTARRVHAVPRNIPTLLTLKVRALYEAGVVPVSEIARLAGVSERTLYKYIQRGSWQRRYGRRALLRGAGGRFIDGAGSRQPHMCGLGALDPAAAARALLACERAGQRASGIAAQAPVRERVLHEFETRVRTLAHLTQVWRMLVRRGQQRV